MNIRKIRAFSYAAGMLSIVSASTLGCSSQAASEDEQRLSSVSDALNNPNGWSLWPVHSIAVCFTTATANDSSLATWRSNVPTWLAGSISSAANLTFTGFGTCGSNTNNMVTITHDGTRGNSQGSPGWQGTSAPSPIIFGGDALDAGHGQGVVIHEMMHTIGFGHEFNRSDNVVAHDCSFQENEPGNTFGTPYDHFSIMNDSYCGFWNFLSPWDMVGLRAAYGKKSSLHGFMIKSDNNSNLAVNAFNGAAEGTVLKLSSACTATNPDCTFTYINGMLLSDRDPTLAVNAWQGATEGATLVLTRACTLDNPDCTWTYSKGEFLSNRNTSLAINAWGGAVDGATLKTTALCSASNKDCTWTLPNVMIPSARNSGLNWNAWFGATNGGSVKLHDSCSSSNTDCTWTLKNGMIKSDTNSTLAVNAFGGAANLTALKLNSACTASNPDCTWTWKNGELLSDSNTTLPVNALNGAALGASLVLNSACSVSNPDCVFWSWIAK